MVGGSTGIWVLLLAQEGVSTCSGFGGPFRHPSVMCARWEGVLARHSGSAALWRAFLAWRRAQFSQFTCSGMRRAYGDAVRVRAWRTLAAR